MKCFTRIAMTAVAFGAFAAISSAGPLGLWFLTDGDNATDALIQGTSVNTFAQAAGTDLQYPILYTPVFDEFETIGRDQDGRGGVYTPGHTVTNTFGNFSDQDGQHLDGTLDTLRMVSYASNFSRGSIIKYGDQFFNHTSTELWVNPEGFIWSITYNAVTDSLFVGGDAKIYEVSMGGALMNSFAAVGGEFGVRSLAYDRSDNTMWYLTNDGTAGIQIDAQGNLISREVYNLGGNYWGGEIRAVPEPATLAVLGLGALALIRRRRQK